MAVASLEAITLPHERIIAAQDQDTWDEAEGGLIEYGSLIGLAKYNSLALCMGSDEVVKRTSRLGALTMLDYKIHDIDDTNFRSARELTLSGGSIITLHASNTTQALREAVRGVEAALEIDEDLVRPWLLGVTVLTSINDEGDETCSSIFGAGRMIKVRQFAHKAAYAGLTGIVCSPQEAEMVKSDPVTAHLKCVLPAIRPEYAIENDEQAANAMTPKRAIEAGGDLLVIGRPLTKARKYGLTGREAALSIAEDIGKAL